MFKLAIEVCFENYLELIHVTFLSLGSTKSVHFFETPGSCIVILQIIVVCNLHCNL